MAREMIQAHERGSAGVIYSIAYFSALVLLFIGERLVVDSTATRIGLACTAAALFTTSLLGRWRRLRRLPALAQPVERWILLLSALGLGAIGLYALQADFAMEAFRDAFASPRAADRYQGALATLWVVLLVLATLPLVFVELAYGPMATGRTVDLASVKRSLASSAILAMSIATVFALNFIASQNDKKVDLSYFKTTKPSESSIEMVKNLRDSLKVTLFYPTADEVGAQVRSYFAELQGHSKHIELAVVDQVIERALAKKHAITDNGIVLFERKGQHHQLLVGTKLRSAKAKLRKLDMEFQEAFLKLSKAQKVAYLTVGHEERGRDKRDGVKGSSINDLRTVLTKLNYRIKDLGIGQGLANEVPKDASVVIVAGPRKPFLAAELAALKSYLRGGGRALLLLDPEGEAPCDELLAAFGLKYVAEPLANDRLYAKVTFTEADRYAIYSNRYGSHASVKTLSRFAQRATTVLFGAGHLQKVPTQDGSNPRIAFTLHGMPFTWNDRNQNRQFDGGEEKRGSFELAAAVAMPPLGAPATAKAKPGSPNEMRLFVLADSDALSDQLFRHLGNAQLFIDAIKWLGGDDKLIGAPSSEEDVRIVHTRKADQLWFYLTIFAVPTLVLAGGLGYTRRRRKRS